MLVRVQTLTKNGIVLMRIPILYIEICEHGSVIQKFILSVCVQTFSSRLKVSLFSPTVMVYTEFPVYGDFGRKHCMSASEYCQNQKFECINC